MIVVLLESKFGLCTSYFAKFIHSSRIFHGYSGLNQKVCEVTEQPTTEAKGDDRREFGDILADIVANTSVPVTVLNVTLMGAFRSDAHIGLWSHPNTILDCSHWCLPGVPDAWNELVFSHLLTNGEFLITITFFYDTFLENMPK